LSQKPPLTIEALFAAAKAFAATESLHPEPSLYGVTDGKAVGTYLEHKFRLDLFSQFDFTIGSSAKGIDLPQLDVDMKVTSIRQPQSSKDARQKVFGLGYSLLIFVYEKLDDPATRTATLKILHVIFVERHRTADYQMTRGLRELLLRNGNKDDVMAFLFDKNLPVDDISAGRLADEILATPPEQGYLTISNALQWRLQYRRVIDFAGEADGVSRIV
jgi:hypothetical protein